jgi:molecular chaperone GrpE
MMRRSGLLERWLWDGRLDYEPEPLEVAGDVAPGDVVTALEAHLAQVFAQVGALETALERERARMGAGATPAAGGEAGGDEMKRLAKSLLPSLDALDRIMEFAESVEAQDEVFRNWVKCIDGLKTRLTRTLEGIGLTAIASVGLPVDLNIHDVVAVVPAGGEYPPNTVVKEQQKGYYFRGKLLRDARVVVAQ